LEALAKKITDNGGEVFYQKLDVTQRLECDNFAKAVLEKWNSIDILVNNAGLMPLSFFKSLKVDEWDKMIDVNIKGVLYSTGAVITHMKEKKSGHIVNLSSVAGRVVFASGSVYCATKFAIAAFSEGLRKEFSARTNIRVTSIEPGVVDTELNDTITEDSLKGFVENAKKMEALHAEDIANAILYAVESPPHVNVNEILIRPTTQEL
jgi:NADP-dependent 3-hydroxy acid dehydrogenase YdfG